MAQIGEENKRFHLQMIQTVINRMSSNSFLIKGWSLTVLSGLTTLYLANRSKSWSRSLLWLGLSCCLVFWINDAYYLLQERRFRKLYKSVTYKRANEIDFSMEVQPKSEHFIRVFFRPIFLASYGIIALAFLIMGCALK